MRHALSTLAASIATVSFGSHALAQDRQVVPIVYESAFFEPFAPQTALDMVERIPGFEIDDGEDRRGLGGATGNIMIDGRLPAAKGRGARGVLRRIPAPSVERIELIQGVGPSASNARPVRLNIVRIANPSAGVWRSTLEYADNGRVSPDIDASWSGRIGSAEYTVSGGLGVRHQPRSGAEITFDTSGNLDERLSEERISDDKKAGISGELSMPLRAGELILSASMESSGETQRETSIVMSGTGVDEELTTARAESESTNGEFSVTYLRPFGDWRHEVSVLYTAEQSDDTKNETELDLSDNDAETTLEKETSRASEAIFRATARREMGNGVLQLNGELAFNTFDQQLRLFEDEGTGLTPVDLPGATTLVEELRTEVGLSHGWDFREVWNVEAGLAYEYSVLSNKADFLEERELAYMKPSVQIARQFGDDDQVRARLYRDVSQLDFEDFAARVELDDNNIIAGNADLRPETSWRLEFAVNWRLEGGAIELTTYALDIDDVQDFALFQASNDRFDTRGNIGNGSLFGVGARLESSIHIIDGARIVIDGLWQETAVTDPLTGETREQSGAEQNRISVEFRHDVERYQSAWGAEFGQRVRAPEFRFDEITEDQRQSEINVWFETSAFGDFKLRLSADGIFASSETRTRRRFDPDRFGVLDQIQRREREPASFISLILEGAF